MINAEVICDSISSQGHRLTTFKLRYPKFIHGEFMTHRVFSRNASSSRAVPVAKNIEEVRSDALRAVPVFWGAEQKGMSPGGELDDTTKSMRWKDRFDTDNWGGEPVTPKEYAIRVWYYAALDAADRAELLMNAGVHKSIVNRVIEPWLHINVVVTATEYMNFFGLRLDSGADPTMRALAEAMWRAYNESKPQKLAPGEWHLPFVENQDFYEWIADNKVKYESHDKLGRDRLIRVSVARCARVSYLSFDTGKRSTIEEDLKLYDRLVGAQPMHASPAEHQATPDEEVLDMMDCPHGWKHSSQHGNFTGWRQFRKLLPGESMAPIPKGIFR